ncbi:hypothetical protein F4778DRAFT_783927 [Xylariomycetidae sp. FL2044]|nr:hypothetical protein F4778DRAFT_783927 [Xylariomycetidae sp. FL2044]
MWLLEPFKTLSDTADRKPGAEVKIIVAGLPRTGTASLKLALEQLGIGPCHHLADPPNQYGRLRLAAEIMNTHDTRLRREKLARLFEGCEALLEQPVSTFLPDLLEMYPDAKVILTERASARLWLDSWLGSAAYTRTLAWLLIGYWMPGVKSTHDMYTAWTRVAASRFGIADDVTEDLYHAHNAWVRSLVPADKLLVYRAEMGYAPLCAFLGMDLSRNLIPHSSRSDRATFQTYKLLAMAAGAITWVLLGWLLWLAGSFILGYAGHVRLDRNVQLYSIIVGMVLSNPKLIIRGVRMLEKRINRDPQSI